MFKMLVKHIPWRGEEVKQRLITEHWMGILALADFVAETARVLCPYDTSKPPGEMHLRDTIQVIAEPDRMRANVVASAPWAEPVEFGHTMRNGRRYPPDPFLRMAVRRGAAEMPRFIGQSRVRQGYHTGQLMGVTFQ